MSLMRLLAVGCSLGRVTYQPNRYRILRRGLPKFGPEKAEQPGKSDKPGVGAVEKNRRKTSTMQHADAKSWGTSGADVAGAVASDEAKPAQKFPLGRWTLFRNPFGNPPQPKSTGQDRSTSFEQASVGERSEAQSPKSMRLVESATPVQGELSLDAVRPVRNDLTDSDVMVIRSLKPSPPPASAAGSLSANSEAPAVTREPVWSRLKHQFFGADKA